MYLELDHHTVNVPHKSLHEYLSLLHYGWMWLLIIHTSIREQMMLCLYRDTK